MHSRCNSDAIIYILDAIQIKLRCNLDAIREEIENEVAMFTTFMGGWVV